MEYVPVQLKLKDHEIPDKFTYPESFDKYLLTYKVNDPFEFKDLDPWGITADAEYNCRLSEKFNLPLVQFAQAWLEDMIACFVVGTGSDPKVLVLNPWALKPVGENKWEEYIQVLEELENFDAWLAWARASDLVLEYAERFAHESLSVSNTTPERKAKLNLASSNHDELPDRRI
ncbi:hypothetical protein [Actimicrobium antarcticum]|uniref:SMI1/KNR4 family protein n=1 Tax=Actimicrobium antarcticum TaxID=1051899 RepID=A0ABP7SWG3_9BURK